MSFRLAVEKRSGPLLVLLSQQHRALVPIVSAVLLLCGLALPVPIGVACLAVLAAFVGWLTYLSWPAILGVARVVRLATFGLIVFAIVSRVA